MKPLKTLKLFFYFFLIISIIGIITAYYTAHINLSLNWQTASRTSADIAPKPEKYADAVVQVYAARTYSWRGLLAVHTWLAAKAKNAKQYKVYQVIGWLKYFGLPALSIKEDLPDRYWFGQKPILLKDVRGKDAEKIIAVLDQTVKSYPYSNHYYYWPGPNSNTFITYLSRNIPELHFAMPSIAIGKDFLGNTTFWQRAPSDTGYQFSFYGILGILVAKTEGLEINILGLVFGINPQSFAIILPGAGDLRI